MTTFEKRRFIWLWLPIMTAGSLIVLKSYTLTLTLNGLTLLGLAIFTTGAALFARDISTGREGE